MQEITYVLCLGDGGNDVSMIQAADAGVGIVGKVNIDLFVFQNMFHKAGYKPEL